MHLKFKRYRTGFTLTEMAVGLGILGLILGSIWVAASRVYQNRRIEQCENEWALLANDLEQLFIKHYLSLPAAPGNGGLPSSSMMIGSSGWYYAGVINAELAQYQWAPLSIIDKTVTPPVLINPWESQTNTTNNGVSQSTSDGVLITIGTLTSGGLTVPSDDQNAMSQYAQQNCGNVQNQACVPTGNGDNAFEIAYNNIPVYACVALAMTFGGTSRPPEVVSIFIGMNNWKAGGGIGLGGQSPLPITLDQATTLCNQTGNSFGGTSSGGGSFIDVVYLP